MKKIAPLLGRIFIGTIFLLAGISKISGFGDIQDTMWAHGIPGAFLPLVIWLEIGGGLALIVGWNVRLAALSLAGLSIFTTVVFHTDFGDQIQSALLVKNIALAGGLLLLAAVGPGTLDLESYLNNRKQKSKRRVQGDRRITH